MQRCPDCGEENPDRFRLCGFCGSALADLSPPPEVRKTVTVVFCDLKGSTSLGEQLDSESLREVLAVYFAAMKTVLERHGGTIEKYIGDAIMAVFGLPRAHEDDALRAVRAAAEMRTALNEVNIQLLATWGVQLENRTGVNTGEVVAGDVARAQRLVTGDTVNVAARLEQAAPTNEVLIGERTYQLVRDAVDVEAVEPLTLKGKAEQVPGYRLRAVRDAEAIARRVDTPMVGRAVELDLLLQSFSRSATSADCRLVTVVGHAGLGKSRLIEELTRRIQGQARVLRGRCLSYGDGITFLPIADVVRQAAGILPQDPVAGALAKLSALLGADQQEACDRLASIMGLSTGSYAKDELFWSVRRVLETLAGPVPLVVVLDDIHWAEPTLLDLLEYVLDTARDIPLLLVCSARHELFEDRPAWADPRENALQIILTELSTDESALIVANLLGDARLPAADEKRILAAAEGNPLYVEQILAMLVDEGVLTAGPDGRWLTAGKPGSISVPPNIDSLVTARLDRLGHVERTIVDRAAVIGTDFSPAALAALDSDGQVADVPLAGLVRKQLIRRADTQFFGEQLYQFSHGLVRDAAYRGLLKRTRAQLHRGFADWLSAMAETRLAEHEEIIGYHLEQAARYLAELGSVSAQDLDVAVRAAGHLASAGRRASARGDMPAAANLLERASLLVAAADPSRPRLLLDAGEALMESGQLARADEVLTAAVEETPRDDVSHSAARFVRMQLRFTTDSQGSEESVLAQAQREIPLLDLAGNDFALARAWRLLTYVHWTATRFGAASEAAERTVQHASAAGDELMARRFLGSLAISALYGPTPVPQAIAQCEEVLVRAGDDRKATALAQLALGHLEAMRGGFDRARMLYRQSRASLEEYGWLLFAALTSLDSAVIEMLAGDDDAAERELRADYAELERMGERNYISTTAGLLAEVTYRQRRFVDCDGFATACATVASPDDVASQFLWRCVRGKLLAQADRCDEGAAMLTDALELIGRSDQLDWQGNGLLDLAEVRQLAGDDAGAVDALQQAQTLFQQKGNTVSAKRAADLAATMPAGRDRH